MVFVLLKEQLLNTQHKMTRKKSWEEQKRMELVAVCKKKTGSNQKRAGNFWLVEFLQRLVGRCRAKSKKTGFNVTFLTLQFFAFPEDIRPED